MPHAYLVIGATGNVGAPLVRQLSARGVDVRAASRHPRTEPTEQVTPVPFDLVEESTWDAALAGVSTLFLVRPPAVGNVGRDIAPVLERARALGVEHVVFLSVQGVGRLRVVPHAAIERWLVSSGMAWTFLRASFFDQNLVTVHGHGVREHDELLMPAGQGRTAFVDAEDVAAVAAEVMLEPRAHLNRAYTPTGAESLTYGEVAAIMTDVLGRPIRYGAPGLLGYATRAGRELQLPPAMVAMTSVVYTTARLGPAAQLTEDVQRVLGRPPTSMAAFVERNRAAFTPAGR